MLIAFRADASPAAGGGHVMRCLALAEELRGRGCEILFLSTPETSMLLPALRRAGYPFVPVGADPEELERAFAGATRRADAMVIDSYALPESYESAARRHADLIAVIDDCSNRRHDCDLLLDQTFGRQPSEFASVVPGHAIVLAGSRYVLMRPEFRRLRGPTLERRQSNAPVRRILVSMGLTDVGGMSVPICEAVAARNPECTIDLVLGSAGPAGEPPHRSIRLHVDPPSMAQLMAEADVAIGAAGTTTWERCCLGLPSVLVALAPNQQQIAKNVAGAGAALHVPSSTLRAIVEACSTLITDGSLRRYMASKAAEICDGLGAGRVADALLGRIWQVLR
jgi:UDP-2,4-diacetamido-2,4,6-trideoxy-beta-L-altropyranose hydrolase